MSVLLGLDPVRVHATVCMLRFYRDFVRSGRERVQDPGAWYPKMLSRQEAAERVAWLVNTAICRKSGAFPPRGRKWTEEYQIGLRRDQNRLEDRRERRGSIYQFETPELTRRFGALLAERDD